MPRLVRSTPGGVEFEYDGLLEGGVLLRENYTSTCAHCDHITSIPSRRKMMEHVEMCRGCMHLICLGCIGKPCMPREKRAEIIEAAARRRASQDFLRDFAHVR